MQNSGIFNSVSGKVRSSGPSVFSAAGPRRGFGDDLSEQGARLRGTPADDQRFARNVRCRHILLFRQGGIPAQDDAPAVIGGRSGMNRRRQRPPPRGYVRGEGII